MTSAPDHPIFDDRRHAGRVVTGMLSGLVGRTDVVVLGLARGGLPVAFEVARGLGAPLDACIVRKLGAPGDEEVAIGALAGDGHMVVNDALLRRRRVTPQQLADIAERESRELTRREAAYRGGRPPVDVTGKTVVLVDDGVATGSTMTVAVATLKASHPVRIVVAVPVGPQSVCRELAAIADRVVCASMPASFTAVGESYRDFTQITDDEVRLLLATPTAGRAH